MLLRGRWGSGMDVRALDGLRGLGYKIGDQVRSSVWQDPDGTMPWLTILSADMQGGDGDEQLTLVVTDHFRPLRSVSSSTVIEHREAWR